jgi:hypothetical protein
MTFRLEENQLDVMGKGLAVRRILSSRVEKTLLNFE